MKERSGNGQGKLKFISTRCTSVQDFIPYQCCISATSQLFPSLRIELFCSASQSKKGHKGSAMLCTTGHCSLNAGGHFCINYITFICSCAFKSFCVYNSCGLLFYQHSLFLLLPHHLWLLQWCFSLSLLWHSEHLSNLPAETLQLVPPHQRNSMVHFSGIGSLLHCQIQILIILYNHLCSTPTQHPSVQLLTLPLGLI